MQHFSTMNFLSELVLLLKARYPLIYISTSEEERIEYLLSYSAKKYLGRAYYSWDFIYGYKGNRNDVGFASRNPFEALELVEKLTPETGAIFVLKDYDNFFKDIAVIRKLKNLTRIIKTQPKNLIIVSSEFNIPEALKELVTVIEFPLPSYQEIAEELKRLGSSLQQNISDEQLTKLAMACQGLSMERIRRVLSKIIAQYGEINDESSNLILEEKKQVIKKSQILEFSTTDKTISDLGGLNNFKNWIKLRANAFSPDAIEYGLPYPKGVLLVGVQGTGKSLAAKVIAHDWNLPLLRLDFGRLFASLVGQSESRARKMINIAEALAPCILWVDEIDKAFASSQSNGDNGTTNRVLATFLTWLSEKTAPVFIVATANNIDSIPPEVMRKGRFDEVFFLSLPNSNERELIFEVHLKRVRPSTYQSYQLNLLSKITKGFSGAEIEQVIIEAMRLAFNYQRDFTTDDLIEVVQKFVPLSQTKNTELNRLLDWAESGRIASASDPI